MNISLPLRLVSIPRSKLLILFLVVFVIFILLFGGAYYWLRVKKEPSPIVKPKEYITTENLWTYVEPDEETRRGYLIPGRTFKIVEQRRDWAKIYVAESIPENSWEGWIKINDAGYKLREKE